MLRHRPRVPTDRAPVFRAGRTAKLGVLARRALGGLASLRLAVVLLVFLGVVLSAATILETMRGREYAQWYVYRSRWFLALLWALGANVTAAMAVRWPWRLRHAGFLVAHLGLLLLLGGAVQTCLRGVEGQLILAEGQAANEIAMTDRSQVRLLTRQGDQVESIEFAFSPGPVDWPAGKQLDLGNWGDVRLKVLAFYRHARPQWQWVPDHAPDAKPAIQLAFSDAKGQPVQRWYTPALFAAPPAKGEPAVWFIQAPAAGLGKDFLSPPAVKPGGRGVLSVHFRERMERLAVDEVLGKKVPVGDTGLAVEILAYYANAVVEGREKFASIGDEPKNPMLQLRVYLPDRTDPLPEVAYANNPLVNYQTMRKQECPVHFWYHHPATGVRPGVEFLETPERTLLCRVGTSAGYRPRGAVKAGDRIPVDDGTEVVLLAYLPHARQEIVFSPAGDDDEEFASAEAAALLELTMPDRTEQFWLRRNDAHLGVRRIESAAGPALVLFGYESYPLGFSVKLLDFRRELNPGGMGEASFASQVQLSGPGQPSPAEYEISMNAPLAYGGMRFYQSGYRQLPGGMEVSVLSVARDPGRLLKYTGSGMICLGIAIMLAMRRHPRGLGSMGRPAVAGPPGAYAPGRPPDGAGPRGDPSPGPSAGSSPGEGQPSCESPPGSLLSPLT